MDVPATEGHFEGGSYEVMVCRCNEVFTTYDGWLTHAHAGGSEQHGGFTIDVRCDNDYMMVKRKSVSPSSYAAQQNSKAVLPYIHCNRHRANAP